MTCQELDERLDDWVDGALPAAARGRGRGAPRLLRRCAASGSAGCGSCSRTPRRCPRSVAPPRDLWPGIARRVERERSWSWAVGGWTRRWPSPRRPRSSSASRAVAVERPAARARADGARSRPRARRRRSWPGTAGRRRPRPGRRRARLRGGGQRAPRGAAAAPGRASQPEDLAAVEANLAGDRPGARRGAPGPRPGPREPRAQPHAGRRPTARRSTC